jgi:branched-chain amino acid transport system substrate-binding protein
MISFDENGDITDRTVSLFQCRHNATFPDDYNIHQETYLRPAPQS